MMNIDENQKRIIRRILKISIWVVTSVCALLAMALCALVWILTPERLTPIAQNAVNEYLNADTKIGRVELTAWSTFPYVTADIQDLSIVSKSLNSLSGEKRCTLPANSDSLMQFKHFHIGINVLKALIGSVSIDDLSIDGLWLNLVSYNDKTSNYDILPPSDDSPLELPTLYWDKLGLTNCRGISYYNATDSTDIDIALSKASLNSSDHDVYHLILDGKASYAMSAVPFVKDIPFDFDGNINWNSRHLSNIGIDNLKAKILDIPLTMNMSMAMENASMIDKFNLSLGPVKFASVIPQLPQVYQDLFANISSDINASIKVSLARPYDLSGNDMPFINAELMVPDSYLQSLDGKNRLDRLALDAKMNINGKKPDESMITLNHLIIDGESVDLELKGYVDNLFTDAHIKGNMKGSANLGKLINVFNLPVNFSIKGEMETNATLDMHLSDLNGNKFQNMKLGGNMDLKNLHFVSPDDTLGLSASKVSLLFGNDISIKHGETVINDLLHMSATIHNLNASMPGMKITLDKSTLAAGCAGNPSNMLDTTLIVPFGARITSGNLLVEQSDGSRIKITNLDCHGDVSRYNNIARIPQIHLKLASKKISYRDNASRVNLHNGDIDLYANIRSHNLGKSKLNRRIDSIRALHPRWTNDSILAVARGGRFKDGSQIMDMSVNNDFKSLIRRWQIHGTVKGSRGRLYTPYFPLKNKLTDIDVAFSMDSFIVHNINYKVGHSTLNIHGGITNLRTTLLGRNRRPLNVNFFVKADTIDVNQLIKAAVDGMAYSSNATGLNALGNAESDKEIDRMTSSVANSSSETLAAFIVPSNIDASIRLRSSNVLYADLFMRSFYGSLLVHDGVVNLRELNAKTDIGSARFNALYAAPTPNDINFGFDLSMKDILIGKFMKMIPSVDSIMPLLNSIDGIIDADIAATANIDPEMNIIMPSLKAAMKLHGDSLVFMDAETFRKVAKMLLFKNKNRNVIDQMTVELLVENSQLELFPFMFDVDRYRLGVLGYNTLDMDFRYHISVLKSPIPFKFGINIYGNPDKMHFRFGGAKYKDAMARQQVKIVDTTQINLRKQINNAFRRGAKAALKSTLKFGSRPAVNKDLKIEKEEQFSHEDSLEMIKGGFFEAPPAPAPVPATATTPATDDKKKSKKSTKKPSETAMIPERETAYISTHRITA